MLYVSLSSHPVAGRPFSGRKAASYERNEAESGSILTARAFDPLPFGKARLTADSAAPTGRLPSSMARWSSCRASDLHGQHLTVDEISQA
jgi:hypothetical protein